MRCGRWSGRQALLLEPSDLVGWRDAHAAVITDREYLAQYRDGGLAHAARFSLERAAGMTLDVYRRVLGLAASSSLHVAPRSTYTAETALKSPCTTIGTRTPRVRTASQPSPSPRKNRGIGVGHTPEWTRPKKAAETYTARIVTSTVTHPIPRDRQPHSQYHREDDRPDLAARRQR